MYSTPLEGASVRELVDWVQALPYGRPSDRSVEAMHREGRGTCSTKHLFLAQALARRFPETRPQIIHRVYTLMPDQARLAFGDEVAAVVPEQGVVDVHRFLTVANGHDRIRMDVTFPSSSRWDGRSSMALACGDGIDHPAGGNPDREKRGLEARYCDANLRDPLIAALGRLYASPSPRRVAG